MSRLTYAEIRTQGGVIGGNDVVDTWIKRKMNAWFRKHYAAYAWPFLTTQATGITLTVGTSQLLVGAGDGGLSRQVIRIFSPIYFRGSGAFTDRGRAIVRQIVGDEVESAIGMMDTTQTGRPQSFIMSPIQEDDGLMKIALVPFPVPDKTYTLAFTYQQLPDDLADADVPLYPNEMTLIQCAKCAAIEYDDSGSQLLKEELNTLADMVAADRDTYGGSASYGDQHQLDSSVFR